MTDELASTTTSEHAEVRIIRKGYEAFLAGDVPGFLAMLSPDIRWHMPGSNALSGDYVGHGGVQEFIGKLFELSGGTFAAELVDVTGGHGRVYVDQHSWATRAEASLDVRDVVVYEFTKGMVSLATIYSGDPTAEETFWH